MKTETQNFPALDAVVTPQDTRSKGGGSYSINYIPWGKISQLLREHAPGWQPITVPSQSGEDTHVAPDGSRYLKIAFQHVDGRQTCPVPHAIMDNRMNSKKTVDSRDIADGFVRGMCKAAALTFGLGIQMWTGDPLDDDEQPVKVKAKPAPKPIQDKTPSPPRKVSSADDKRSRFTGEGLLQKTKPQLIAMIADSKAERRLEREEFVEIARSVGVDYDGGNPANLTIADLRDFWGALQDVAVPTAKDEEIPF